MSVGDYSLDQKIAVLENTVKTQQKEIDEFKRDNREFVRLIYKKFNELENNLGTFKTDINQAVISSQKLIIKALISVWVQIAVGVIIGVIIFKINGGF